MTAGKNPRNFKKKAKAKKSVHPFAKKEWYNVLAPGFEKRTITMTPVNKTAGLVNSADSLRGRVFQMSLGDCNTSADTAVWKKLQFQIEEIKNFDCYTNFYGMDITRDHGCAMIKKWHTLIEAFVQAKTTDGFYVRMFCIAFTKKTKKQVKATCYAKASHQKLIRKKMMEIMQQKIQTSSFKDLTKLLLKDDIGKQIQKECSKIFPLEDNCMIRKFKLLKKPKFDLVKLMDLYKDTGAPKPTGDAPKNALEATQA
jgi:small subunit ribosomal protein S3Ae